MDFYDIESHHVGSKDEAAASIGVDGSGDGISIGVDGSRDYAFIYVDGSGDDASSDVEDPHQPLLDTIGKMFKTLMPPLTSECCIYKIPKKLRKVNETAYTPQVISIGPFHHGNEHLQNMEKHKERFLNQFIERAHVRLEDLVSSVKEWEERVRRCYAEPIELSSDEFVKMILLDGSFIIEFFLKCHNDKLMDENDKVLFKPWLDNEIRFDLIFLENQLPLFVFEKMYDLAYPITNDKEESSFLDVACWYFAHFNPQKITPKVEVKHFTDLIRIFHLPSSPRLPPKEKKGKQLSYTAMELHHAGVKFKVSSEKCLFDIHFTNGELHIPFLNFDDKTEYLARNLMALEQCHYPDKTDICDYIMLLDSLINTEKDVELLVQNEIIFNWLGGNDVLTTVVNNLCRETLHDLDKSYFCKLGEDLTKYYKKPWNCWWALFHREYFSTPWKIASVGAASTLLALTFMQTVNSF